MFDFQLSILLHSYIIPRIRPEYIVCNFEPSTVHAQTRILPPSSQTPLLRRPQCQEEVPMRASRTSNKQINEHSRNTLNMATMIPTSMAILADQCPHPGQTSPQPPPISPPTSPIHAVAQHLLQAAHMDTIFLTCLHICGSLAQSSSLRRLRRVIFEHTSMA